MDALDVESEKTLGGCHDRGVIGADADVGDGIDVQRDAFASDRLPYLDQEVHFFKGEVVEALDDRPDDRGATADDPKADDVLDTVDVTMRRRRPEITATRFGGTFT